MTGGAPMGCEKPAPIGTPPLLTCALAGLLRALQLPCPPLEACWRAVCSAALANPENYCIDE